MTTTHSEYERKAHYPDDHTIPHHTIAHSFRKTNTEVTDAQMHSCTQRRTHTHTSVHIRLWWRMWVGDEVARGRWRQDSTRRMSHRHEAENVRRAVVECTWVEGWACAHVRAFVCACVCVNVCVCMCVCARVKGPWSRPNSHCLGMREFMYI
jgi:hypothetical protein